MAFQMDCITHKKTNNMKKLITLFFILNIACSALAFKYGNLYYAVTSSVEPYTVSVIQDQTSYSSGYSSSNIIIPETVIYDNKEYKVTGIQYKAFLGCTNLKSIQIPNSVVGIGWQAFSGCTSLSSVTLPDSLKSIGYEAFRGCLIKHIVIPINVKDISWGVFENCKLESIRFLSTVPPVISNNKTITSNPICYVPCGTYNAYASTSLRDMCYSLIEQPEYNIVILSNNILYGTAKIVSRPDCEGAIITAIPNDGCTFVKWSDGNTQATRYLELTEDVNLTAYFAKEGYTIHVYQDCNITIE